MKLNNTESLFLMLVSGTSERYITVQVLFNILSNHLIFFDPSVNTI